MPDESSVHKVPEAILDQRRKFFKQAGKFDENLLTAALPCANIKFMSAGRFEKVFIIILSIAIINFWF